jgi:hypothetical protein
MTEQLPEFSLPHIIFESPPPIDEHVALKIKLLDPPLMTELLIGNASIESILFCVPPPIELFEVVIRKADVPEEHIVFVDPPDITFEVASETVDRVCIVFEHPPAITLVQEFALALSTLIIVLERPEEIPEKLDLHIVLFLP